MLNALKKTLLSTVAALSIISIPMSAFASNTNVSMSQGSSNVAFTSNTQQPMGPSGGNIKTNTLLWVTSEHHLIGKDYLSASGEAAAIATSVSTDSVSVQSSQNISATDTILAVSYPGAPSITPSPYSININYPATTPINENGVISFWGTWKLSTAGRFNGLVNQDIGIFRIGASFFNVTNQITVSIS